MPQKGMLARQAAATPFVEGGGDQRRGALEHNETPRVGEDVSLGVPRRGPGLAGQHTPSAGVSPQTAQEGGTRGAATMDDATNQLAAVPQRRNRYLLVIQLPAQAADAAESVPAPPADR